MTPAKKVLIYNAVIVPGTGEKPFAGAVLSSNGIISGIFRENQPLPEADEHTDAQGGLLMPGLIDTHVHFREPGMTHKGCIATESRAAIAGGVTSYIDMPNTQPPTTDTASWQLKFHSAANSSAANFGFFIGATKGIVKVLGSFDRRYLPGVKLFMGNTTGSLSSPSGAELEDMFALCAERNIIVMVHAEDNDIIAANTTASISKYGTREAVPLQCHSTIRSRRACMVATNAAIELARRFGTRLHIAHISTAEEIGHFFKPGEVGDKLITCETTPLYLDPLISASETLSWRHKVNPAVKTASDAECIRKALADGRIDTIGTDHAPHLVAEKHGGALTAASGAPSIQFALPVMLSYLPAELIANKMAYNPAKLFGITNRGSITEGNAADLVLIKETEAYTISDKDVITPAGWTPFHGRRIRHRVASTWLAGECVYADGKFIAGPTGAQALTFGV